MITGDGNVIVAVMAVAVGSDQASSRVLAQREAHSRRQCGAGDGDGAAGEGGS